MSAQPATLGYQEALSGFSMGMGIEKAQGSLSNVRQH